MNTNNTYAEIFEPEDGLFMIVFTEFPDGSGDGYEWEALIQSQCNKAGIDLSQVVMDSESDMFSAYACHKDILYPIVLLIDKLCNQPEKN